jgi:hypothetical protein
MRKTLFIFLPVVVLISLFDSCSKKNVSPSVDSQYGRGPYAADTGEVPFAPGTVTTWAGTGFNSEGPSGIEGQTPPAFEDMSNLYGRIQENSTSETGTNQGYAVGEKTRKLIKSAEIRIRVNSLEETGTVIAEMLKQYNAYSSYTVVHDNSRNYTLKIPTMFFETVLTGISGMGKVLYSSSRIEDTTIKFYDLDNRLHTKEELINTFRSYLKQAKTIDEIMRVEKYIADLQQEIDWLGSQLSDLSHLIDYATVNLELQGPIADSTYYIPGLKERIGELFTSFGGYLSTVIVVLAGIALYGLPILFIFILLFWIFLGKIGLLKKIWRLISAEKIKHKN